MVYEHYLAFGGNEIVNSPRAYGIHQTAPCLRDWMLDPGCEGVRSALNDPPYTYENIESAPWYDPENPDVSSRFYGAYGLGFVGVADSTRQVQVVQGLGDGGSIGSMRKGVRQVRVRVSLLANGSDAMEYGRAWLESALDPGACGQHGGECGTADVAYFATCPPLRGIIDYFSPWEERSRNLLEHSSLGSSSEIEIYRNKFINASFEAAGGTLLIRENLNTNPRMYQNNAGWTAAEGGVMTATPLGALVQFSSGGSGAAFFFQTNPISATPSGGTLSSIEVTVPSGYPAIVGLCARTYAYGSNAVLGESIPITLQPGETRTLATNERLLAAKPVGTTGVKTILYATTAIPTGARIFVRNALIEHTASLGPYFDGSTPLLDPDYTVSWAGGVDASTSRMTAPAVSGITGGDQAIAHQSSSWASAGAKSLKVIPLGVGVMARAHFQVAGLKPFATYSIVAKIRLAEAQAQPLHGEHRMIKVTGTGIPPSGGKSLPAPNVPGVHNLSTSFTLGDTTLATVSFINGSLLTPVWFDDVAIVEGYGGAPYFDGSTSSDPDLTPSWEGPPHASESVLTGRPVAGVSVVNPEGGVFILSTKLDDQGNETARFLRLHPGKNAYVLLEGRTAYPEMTVMFDYLVEHPVALSSGIVLFDTDMGANSAFIAGPPPFPGVWNSVRETVSTVGWKDGVLLALRPTAPPGGSVWYSMPGLFAGNYDGPWFSGNTDDSELNRYAWAGVENASESIWEAREALQRPQTDEEWANSIDDVRRFLHGVAATSGPLTVDERRSGAMIRQTVEFTLTASRPWIYGITREVELPTTPSSVVEDVQYNLTPYPSMEVAGSDVVISQNLSTNPSVEVNATGWSQNVTAVSGAAPSAFVTSGRSTELAAHGSASFRTRLLGDGATAATGRALLTAFQDVAIPSSPLRMRLSVSIWAAMLKASGSAATVLHSMIAQVGWLNSGGAYIGSFVPLPAASGSGLDGQVFSGLALLPPAGATSVRVMVRAEASWESSATPANNSDIRLYLDALAVTTP